MENKTSSLKKLSLWQVTIIGIAYMTPMTVFDTFGIVSGITNGHVPLAYLLALGAMLLTAWSYARFSKNSEKSGSAYSYTAESLGPKSGFFVGWCSLLKAGVIIDKNIFQDYRCLKCKYRFKQKK